MTRPTVVALLIAAVITAAQSQQAAHYKYSREANEAAARDDYIVEDHGHHGHSHEGGGCPHSHGGGGEDHAHSHSHYHEDHGHSHDAHDHGHSHEDGHAHSHGDAHGHAHSSPQKKKGFLDEIKYEGVLSFMNDARTRLWVHALGSTLLISIAPFFILFAIPIQSNTAENEPLLKVLLAFGSGGLLGDAFLHLIPHATPEGGHSHSHSHGDGHSHEPHDMSVGGWVLAGIISFLAVEKFVRIMRGEEGHGHSHGHSHSHKKDKHSDDEGDKKKEKKPAAKTEEKSKKAEAHEGIKVAAYLNLVADFAHNFTDGLAIGASFIAGSTIGVVTMVTVLVHEVPHEIGDFAILVQSGYSRGKAMAVQLITALGALSGCVLSLVAADATLADTAASSWVLPFTAGGFIYIATVSVIPELLENSSFSQSIKEIVALLLGIFLMYLIAFYE